MSGSMFCPCATEVAQYTPQYGIFIGNEVSHVIGSDVTGRGHVQKYVLPIRNRKLRIIRRSRALSPEVKSIT